MGPALTRCAEIHRCERFTPRDSLFPDVREIRWFLYLRFRPRRSRLGAVQRSSANGRAISAGILDASESFPLAFRSGRLITKRKRAALHRKRNLPQSATLAIPICDLGALDPQAPRHSGLLSGNLRTRRLHALCTRCNLCRAQRRWVNPAFRQRRVKALFPSTRPETKNGLANQPDLGRLSERTLGGSSPPATCAAQITKELAENEPRTSRRKVRYTAPLHLGATAPAVTGVILRPDRSKQPRPRGAAQRFPQAPYGNQAAHRSDAASIRRSTFVPAQQSEPSGPH